MRTVIVEETYGVRIEKVWKALTEKEEMKKWYFDLSEFKPEVGFEFKFTGKGSKGELYVHRCRVTKVIPMTMLQYSWAYENREGLSTVTFDLFEVKKGTLLRVTHTGLDSFPQGHPDFALDSFQKGWNSLLKDGLRKYLANETDLSA